MFSQDHGELSNSVNEWGEEAQQWNWKDDSQRQEAGSKAGQDIAAWLVSRAAIDGGWYLTFFYLGAGESGKSTILKQMRIIYAEGFRPEERREVRQVIFSNMIVAFKIIAEEMRELGVEYENQQSQVYFLPDL